MHSDNLKQVQTEHSAMQGSGTRGGHDPRAVVLAGFMAPWRAERCEQLKFRVLSAECKEEQHAGTVGDRGGTQLTGGREEVASQQNPERRML